MGKLPNWTRDELILALDLYFRIDPTHLPEADPEITALSNLLRALPIHAGEDRDQTFRNTSSVSMKLSNFLHLDPKYPGEGLSAISKLDRVIWDEFSSNRERLEKVAAAIRHNYQAVASLAAQTSDVASSPEEEFPEGRVLTRLHKVRERNAQLVKRKKEAVRAKTGKLACEACGFDFAEKYGKLGDGFAECHHTVPVSELDHENKTKLSDLAIVCSNCHSMLHRARPVLTVEALRAVVQLDTM